MKPRYFATEDAVLVLLHEDNGWKVKIGDMGQMVLGPPVDDYCRSLKRIGFEPICGRKYEKLLAQHRAHAATEEEF